MSSDPVHLPVYEVADAILKGLQSHGAAVLSAPTGSGKSTQVPQLLLDRAGLPGEIIVLQPRRLAARLLAQRVALERGVALGDEVGYQIRFENRTSARTRIRFVTEAILLRKILEDPALPGVAALVFDEFHERHLSSDLALACALQASRVARPDLKLLVMSATLDIARLETFLQPCARVEARGRLYPVEVRYTGASLGRNSAPVWDRAAAAFRQLVRGGAEGDALVFMPGAFEIRRTIEAISALPEASGFEVLPLHGELPRQAQDRAVRGGDGPKVIVSTNVAETSITIEGVRAVIDGGFARVARYDARRGINSILVEPISRASAEQRKGRAGRTGPGVCLRLWSEVEQAGRPGHETPEVKRVDLAETVLMLAVSGVTDLDRFGWFEAPEEGALQRARDLLCDLGAMDAAGRVTGLGRQMAAFPLHPRYARLLIEGQRLGVLDEAALLAGISQGRPFYRPARDAEVRREQVRQIEDTAGTGSDFFLLLRAFEWAQAARFKPAACAALGINGQAARQAGEVAKQILHLASKHLGPKPMAGSRSEKAPAMDRGEALRRCLFLAFADHLCLRRDRGTRRCRMVHGRSGELRRESQVASSLFVASELEERELRGEVGVLLGLATAVEVDWLQEYFPEDMTADHFAEYDPTTRRVTGQRQIRFRDLVLESKEGGEVDPDEASQRLAAEVIAERLHLKNWDTSVESWIRRVNFVATHCPETEIEPIGADARQLLIEQICQGATSYKAIKDRPVLPLVKQWIGPEQAYYIDAYAPAEMELPRRKRPVRLRYEADGRAFIASKLQDFYDVPGQQLRIGNGRVPLVIELLAPNGRPAHITDDLDGFWDGAYRHVRKDLAGRYPKHEWR